MRNDCCAGEQREALRRQLGTAPSGSDICAVTAGSFSQNRVPSTLPLKTSTPSDTEDLLKPGPLCMLYRTLLNPTPVQII